MWLWVALLALLFVSGRVAVLNPPGTSFPSYILKIAQAIARAEGYYAGNTLPYRRNNPGSIIKDGQLVAYATPDDGWNALYRQIQRMLSGSSAYYSLDMSLLEIARVYTGNDKPDAWARIVSGQLGSGITPETIWGNIPQLLEA